MTQALTSPELRSKLQKIKEERGITAKLRTHLRALLVKELQSGPTAIWTPVITVYERALGSLLVEWLRIHKCHYTISVLVSEVPSFANLPGLAGVVEQNDQKKEVEGILSVLGLGGEDIIGEYERSSDSLLSCILRVAASWKKRLQFKEMSLNLTGRNEPMWSGKLKEIIASSCLDPSQMTTVYCALHNLIQNEIDECLAKDRSEWIRQRKQDEKKILMEIERQEKLLQDKLLEAEEGLYATRERVGRKMEEDKQTLTRIFHDVCQQHQLVVRELADLAERESKFEASKKTWQAKLARERLLQNQISEELAKRIQDFEEEKKNSVKQEIKKAPSTADRSTLTTPTINVLASKEKITGEDLLISHSKIFTQKSRLERELEESTSSLDSTTKSSEINAAFKRLKSLCEDSNRGTEKFLKSCQLALDSESSTSCEIQVEDGQRRNAYLKTGTSISEKSHYESAVAERKLLNTKRYRHLLATGGSLAQSRIPCGTKNAKWPFDSGPLNMLIQATRSTDGSREITRTVQSIREEIKEQKLKSLISAFTPGTESSVREAKRNDDTSENSVTGTQKAKMKIERDKLNTKTRDGETGLRIETDDIVKGEQCNGDITERTMSGREELKDPAVNFRKDSEVSQEVSIKKSRIPILSGLSPDRGVKDESIKSMSPASYRSTKIPSRPSSHDSSFGNGNVKKLSKTTLPPPSSLLLVALDSDLSEGEVISVNRSHRSDYFFT